MGNGNYDIVIVGAGPAGATAAFTLARAGASVALVDKTVGAKEKVCGGGLLAGSLDLLRQFGLYDRIITPGTCAPGGARVSSPDGTLADLTFPPPQGGRSEMLRIIRRQVLDKALLEASVTAGAVPLNARACGMEVTADGAVVHIERDDTDNIILGKLVIAADGSTGSFSNNLGVRQGSILCPAVRAYVTANDRLPSTADFHFSKACIPLYCWVFPVEPGLCNIGLAVAPGRKQHLAELLKELLTHNPLVRDRLGNPEIVGNIQGGFLRTGYSRSMATRDRLLVAGDAAALVSPLTGEGISQAIRSGMLAAECALAALESGRFTRRDLESYPIKLDAVFSKRNRQLWQLNKLISTPGVMNRMVRLLRNDAQIQVLLARTLANPSTWGNKSLGTLMAKVLLVH